MSRDPTRAPARRLAPEAIAFAGGTLDRAAHLRADDRHEELRRLDASRAVLVGPGQEVAVTEARTLALVPVSALAGGAHLTFLGLDPAGAAVFAYDALDDPDDWWRRGAGPAPAFVPLRDLAAELGPADGSLAAYAVGMIGWHRVNRHCGRSGHATVVEQAGHRRRCPACGLLHFPRTDPAVTMLVQAGDHCLLSRRRGAPERRWSALAGFVEPGETLEEAVVREAREETGVEIVAVEYVVAQPWPFPSALMLGFWAFVDPSAGAALEPQPEELVAARWFERAELADAVTNGSIALPPPRTIGNYLISTWVAAG